MQLRKLVGPYVPKPLKQLVLKFNQLRYLSYRYGRNYYCPACNAHARKFLDFDLSSLHVEGGIVPKRVVSNTCCPWCGSHIHHRLMWLVLPNLLDELQKKVDSHKRLLHFAPEGFSIPKLQQLAGIQYIQTDYMRLNVDVTLDMCCLGLASNSIDLVIASHVLEHVGSDDDALEELYRILKPGGIAVLLVPLLTEKSIELPNVHTELDRIKYYGQNDHVRAYGLDLKDKIDKHGFDTRIMYAEDFDGFDKRSYLLPIQGRLFLATKPHIKAGLHA